MQPQDFLKAAGTSQDGNQDPRITELDAEYPIITSFLFCEEIDGDARPTGGISLFTSEGRMKARFYDPYNRRVGWYTIQVPCDLFAELETAWLEKKIDWREEKDRRQNF